MSRPTIDYGAAVTALGFETEQRGIWRFFGHAQGDYGWKLHLSSVQSQAEALLHAVVPVLVARGASFKLAKDSAILGLLNEGTLGDTQVGKFVTVYPKTLEEGMALAQLLIGCTNGFDGPKIVTDLHLGSVVYARYGPFSPQLVRNRLGLYEPADGTAAAYRVPFAVPEGIDNPFESFSKAGAPAPRPGGPAPIGPGYLILDVLQSESKGSIFKALDLRDRSAVAIVILKEGRHGCMSDVYGRAMKERLENQYQVHTTLAGCAAVPAADPIFAYEGNWYLPLEYVDGVDFGSRPAVPYRRLNAAARRKLLQDFVDIACAIDEIHRRGVVHRDISMRNIRIEPNGTVRLIDFEIAHRLADTALPPLTQGTPGFVSPQQLAEAPPSCADDVYAFGAVMVCALTGLDPKRVLWGQAARRDQQLTALSGAPAGLCRVVAACVDEAAENRPVMHDLIAVLSSVVGDDGTSDYDPPAPPGPGLRSLAESGTQWVIKGAPREEGAGMWRSPEVEAAGHASLKLVNAYKVYRSANQGVAGVVYLLGKLARFGCDMEPYRAEVEGAVDWLLYHYPTPDDQMVGLHFGEAGVAVALCEALAGGLIEPGVWLRPYLREALSAPLDWPDVTHGAAGQGLAALICGDLLHDPEIAAFAQRCAAYLRETQGEDGAWTLPKGVEAMSGGTFTGFAHGVAGIVAFLSEYAARYACGRSAEAARHGGRWLLEQARPGERGLYLWWPMRTDSPTSWAWWCHGAPGIAQGLLPLYRLTGERRLLGAIRAALRTHPSDARHPNMSQCHGLSGLGEIYLDAHRVLGEEEWLQRAESIGDLLANLARIDEDGASWLVENPYQPTPDLMIGCGGVVHFLARLSCGQLERFRAPLAV